MKIEYSKRFVKEFRKCPEKIRATAVSRLRIFVEDREHPSLNDHPLIGRLKDCRSINITGDWRAIYEELDGGKVAHFVAIGTHSQLYS